MEILASSDMSTLWFYTTEEAHRYMGQSVNYELMDLMF